MRYIPVKRTAVDGRVWWVVWDCKNHKYSTCVLFGRYERKKDCEFDIRFKTERYPQIMDIA